MSGKRGILDRNFLVHTHNENNLRSAIERNTRYKQEVVFARALLKL